MKNEITYVTLEDACAAMPSEQIHSDGRDGTCLWHRQHEHYLEHVVPLLPRCPICKGVGDPRQPRHELCHIRVENNLPTPPIHSIAACGCGKCSS